MKFRNMFKQNKRRGQKTMCVVAAIGALATAYVLMVPAITITDDAATPEAGFFDEGEQAQAPEPDAAADPAPAGETPEPEPAEEPSDPAGEPADEGTSENEATESESVEEDAGSEAEASSTDDGADAEADATDADADAAETSDDPELLYKKVDLGDGTFMDIRVEDPDDVLPEGTRLEAGGIDQAKLESTLDLMKAKAEEEEDIDPALCGVIAADLKLVDADGNVVEPSGKIRVKVACPAIERDAQFAIVHVKYAEPDEDHNGINDVDEGKEEPKDKANIVPLKEVDLDGHAVQFEVKDFKPYAIGPYAIVYIPPAEEDEQGEGADDAEGEEEAGLITTEDETPDETVEDEGEPVELTPENAHAQSFEGTFEAADGTLVNVAVDADECTFPDGTTMHVEAVEEQEVLDAAMGEAEDSTGMEPEDMGVLAADITFADAEGNEIEPAKPVHVAMVAQDIPDLNQMAVVHVDDEQTATLVEDTESHVNLGAVYFDADAFSVYALVYSAGQLEKTVITASGDTYVITVTYDATAQIPDGAELRVREIPEEDEEYATVQEQVKNGVAEEGRENIPSHPTLFDISIWADDQEIEPAEGSEVQVRIEFADNTIKGLYTDEDTPILVNDMPVHEEEAGMDTQMQVLHMLPDGQVEAMEMTQPEVSADTGNDNEIKTDVDVESDIETVDNDLVANFTTDSFSNWLVYLDEDLADINLTTSDSLTLRPYTEWVWKSTDEPAFYQNGQWTFPSSEWNSWTQWDNGVQYTFYQHKTNGSQFRSFSKTDDQLHETYTVVTSVNLNAGTFDIQTNKGKTIHVHVTQGASSPKPATVAGIPGLTVNLFDYDVPYQNGQFDFTKSGVLDDSGNTAASPFNNTVNIGHNLKFLGWGASGDTGTINAYTNENPRQGIVQDSLDSNGYPVLNDGSSQSLDYLFNTSSHNSSVYAFANAGGLFRRDNQGYYYYNSNVNYAEYDQNSNSFILYDHTYSQNTGGSNGANAKPFGFFPFHEYDASNNPQPSMNHNTNLNHHFGMSMTVDFEIPKDRQMEDDSGNKHDIIYEFSGDDDLWVFVDDELALDIGGIHQPVTGSINFTTGVITVHGKDNITKTFDVGAHTLKMFYIERGGCDSNLSVRFNLPLTKGKAELKVLKKSMTDDATEPDKALPGATFGVWTNPDCTGDPYMTTTSDADGMVTFGSLPIEDAGQVYYLREIAPPPGFLPNKTIYTATAQGSEGNFTFVVEPKGEVEMEYEGDTPVVRDGRPDPINLTVQKQWQNADGTTMENPSGTATFQVMRKYTWVEGSVGPENSIINVYRVDANWNNARLMETREYAGNSTASVNWTYSQYLWDGYKNWNYRVNNGSTQTKGNGPAIIHLSAGQTTNVYIFDGNLGGQYEQYGVENITVSGTEPDSSSGQITTGEGDDTEYQGPEITLPTSDNQWRDTVSDLPAMEEKNNRTYFYEYYVVEKSVPDGFEAVYLDGSGKPIADPKDTATNTSGSQTVVNRKLLDVPIEKQWGDFVGDEYTWTATFQLEQREVKVNSSDPDASDAITRFVAVEGKTLSVTKDDDPLPTFDGLPMYRVHDNGTLYRIIYSVEETSYTVMNGDAVVARWIKGNPAATVGDVHTPQFDQDAGENGSAIEDYEIKVVNYLADLTVTNHIDLGIQKTWPTTEGIASDPDAYATFVLKRLVHQEYRDYTDVPDDATWVDVTLDTGSNSTKPQTVHVPEGTELHIVGSIKGETNANKIVFKQSSGQPDIEYIEDNTQSKDKFLFDIKFTADQTKTVSLYQGDPYVVGGRDGFFLSDTYEGATDDEPDPGFAEEFTLNATNGWHKEFEYLPQIVEEDKDPTEGTQNIYVYSYYLEEVDCNPEGYSVAFTDGDGHRMGDVANGIDVNQTVTAANTEDFTELTVTKAWEDEGDVNHANNTVGYKIYRTPCATVPDPDNPGQTMEVELEPEEVTEEAVPSMQGYTGELKASNNPEWTEKVTDLPKSGYRVYDEQSGKKIPVQYSYFVMEDAFSGYRPVITKDETGTNVFNITNVPHGPLDVPTEVEITKQWNDVSGDEHDSDHITIQLTQTKYETNLYPVRINLVNGDGSVSDLSQTIYMPANCALYLTPETNNNGHRVSSHGMDNDSASAKSGKQFILSDASGGKDVTFTLLDHDDRWSDNVGGHQWTLGMSDGTSNSSNIIYEDQLADRITDGDQVGDPTHFEYEMELNEAKTGTVIRPHENAVGVGECKGNDEVKWNGKIEDLPFIKKDEDGEFYLYTYEVSEIKIGETTVSPIASGEHQGETPLYYVDWSGADDVWTITNQRKPVISLTLKKVRMGDLNNPSAPPLPGAAFSLTKYTDNTYTEKDSSWAETVVTDVAQNGTFQFTELSEGYYQINETTTPPGYVKSDVPPRFHVKHDLSIELIDSNGNPIETSDVIRVENATSTNPSLVVGNAPGTPLPHTGGSGTALLTLIGALLVVFAGAGLVMKRRRRNAS